MSVVGTSNLWPDPGPGNSWGHWVVIAERLGATFPLTRAFLIGIRGVRPWETTSHDVIIRPAYDDTFVLLSGDGRIPPAIFAGSTHAYQTNSKASPDVDGDGRGDVGTIKPGRFVAHRREGKYPVFEVTLPDGTKRLPCYRDLTHTGKLEDGGYTADSILIHWGYNAASDSDHKSSIGCQTMDLTDLRMLDREAKRSGGEFDFVLETIDGVLAVVPEPMPDTERPNA